MKRIIAVICSLLLIVVILSCGRKGPPTLPDYDKEQDIHLNNEEE